MHIPDGFLDPAWSIITYLLFLVYLGYTLRAIKGTLSSEIISYASVLAAGVFAAQMLNWPLPGGTSLHFVGGALAGIMLGPYVGFLAMFLVLLIQCIVFHDGGITALGANVLNMAIVDVIIGYIIYRALIKTFKPSDNIRFVGAFLGGWLGITLAGIACGVEIGLSPQFPYGVSISVPVMGIWHAVLGIIEGLATAFTIIYISKRAPHMILAEV